MSCCWRGACSVSPAIEVLGDLPFELDAVGAVLGHGFHPLKARQPGSTPNPQSVHRQGSSFRDGRIEDIQKRSRRYLVKGRLAMTSLQTTRCARDEFLVECYLRFSMYRMFITAV